MFRDGWMDFDGWVFKLVDHRGEVDVDVDVDVDIDDGWVVDVVWLDGRWIGR